MTGITDEKDKVMMWLDSNIEQIMKSILKRDTFSEWTLEEMKNLRKDITDLFDQEEDKLHLFKNEDQVSRMLFLEKTSEFFLSKIDKKDLPENKSKIDKKIWSLPILINKVINNQFPIREFIDFVVYFDACKLIFCSRESKNLLDEKERIEISRTIHTNKYCFEVHTTLPSCIEILQQIQTHRFYGYGEFFVVGPENTFVDILTSQGVGFLNYNTEEVFLPNKAEIPKWTKRQSS